MAWWPKLQIYHGPRDFRKEKIGVKGDYHITFQRRELPDAGAMQYSYETFGMPAYSPIGPTVRVHIPNDRYQPASYVFQAVALVGMPPINSVLQGQSVAQPLMDPTTATALGLAAQNPPVSPLAQFNPVSNNGLALTG
jgi:hypothetical protein